MAAADESSFLSGRDAAALLGVKRETLYAYASRGLVRSEPGGPGRERRYSRDDLERLKARHDARAGHGPVAAGALRWGEPVLESALTDIDPTGPRYRGHAALTLAATASYEAVAELLWSATLPPSATWPTPPLGLRLPSLTALLPAGAAPLTTLALAVPALAAATIPTTNDGSSHEHAPARTLIRQMAILAGAAIDPSRVRPARSEPDVASALLVALGARPDASTRSLMSSALILCADHELNASTFAVRVAASAGADLHACVSAGLATLSGPRHGGAGDSIAAILGEIRRPADARDVVLSRTTRGDEIPGFGHPLYPHGDPRAAFLLTAATVHAPRNPRLRKIHALVESMSSAGRDHPNLDIGLAAVGAALGLDPRTNVAMFAIGRTAGWIAHILEQRSANFLLRPRARYTGP